VRKIARTKNYPKIQQVILYADEHGVYVFPCISLEDGFAISDTWYEDLATAEAVCYEQYSVMFEDWQLIPEPLQDCQQDWINPVRIVGREIGNPQWGRLEKLVDGRWMEIELVDGKWVYRQS
jgi:hypothetical protein